jgi:hypothetical protein
VRVGAGREGAERPGMAGSGIDSRRSAIDCAPAANVCSALAEDWWSTSSFECVVRETPRPRRGVGSTPI